MQTGVGEEEIVFGGGMVGLQSQKKHFDLRTTRAYGVSCLLQGDQRTLPSCSWGFVWDSPGTPEPSFPIPTDAIPCLFHVLDNHIYILSILTILSNSTPDVQDSVF